MRMNADERREQVLRAAVTEFAKGGLDGTSTEAIAKRAGISQPYLFRLFPSKKDLFSAVVQRNSDNIGARFEEVCDGLTGEDALHAMGEAYQNLISDDRDLLLVQLHGFAACHDETIRDGVGACMTRLFDQVERLSGVPQDELVPFFATGMLCNVVAAMDSERLRGLIDTYFEHHPNKLATDAGHVADASTAVT